MFDLLLMSHGTIAKAFYDTMEMILGEPPIMRYCAIAEGESSEDFATKLHQTVDLHKTTPLLVLLDLYSGSPCRVAISQLLISERPCFLIAGMNLPIIMEAYASRSQELSAILPQLLTASKDNVIFVNELLTQADKDEENE